MATIEFRQNTKEVIETVAAILSQAKINFEHYKPEMKTISLGFSGNTAEIMSNHLIVTENGLTVEFTGMGGYYTDYGLQRIYEWLSEIQQ